MIVLHLDIVLVTLKDLLGESRLCGRCRLVVAITEGVALLVGLSRNVETVLVAEVVPAWIIGIVTSAHGVDVEPLHDLDILKHALRCDNITTIRVHLVAVGTFDIYGLAIDEKLTVLDLYLAEAHLLRNDLHDVALTVFYKGLKGEEIRRLCRPLLHIAHHEACCALRAATEIGGLLGYDSAVGIEQTELYDGVAFDPSIDEQLTVLIIVLQIGCDADVLHLHLWVLGKEIALTRHAGETPEVLVLIHGAVAPAEGLESDEVLAGMEILRDVKLSGYLRVLGVAHILSVDKEVHVRRDAAEMGDDLLAVPRSGELDDAAVRTYVVVLHGHACRRSVLRCVLRLPAFVNVVVLELVAPGKADVDILRVTITVEFPDAGDVHRLPRTVVEVRLVEVLRTLIGILDPVEFPWALKGEIIG